METDVNWGGWLVFLIAIVVVLVAVFAISALMSIVVRTVARRHQAVQTIVDRGRWPFRTMLLVIGVWIAIAIAFHEGDWRGWVNHLMLIALIAASAWLVAQMMLSFLDLWGGRYRAGVSDTGYARRVRTQLQVVRRLGVAIIVIVAVGSILLTFDGVRAVGASVLASAGIASVVAGLAAQTLLANVFAGVQIAFSSAIRVDDVVVVDDEWGRIREITLTYVVVTTWDERTLVLPCTYFTTTPFENWTKYGNDIFGSIEFDVDWRISVDAMRDELDRLVHSTDLWDRRTVVLQVIDASAGYVRIRAFVSASNSANLWDLRCMVREDLIAWVRDYDQGGLPQHRVLIGAAEGADAALAQVAQGAGQRGAPAKSGATGATGSTSAIDDATTDAGSGDDGSSNVERTDTGSVRAGMFSGSAEAEKRASSFTQAIPAQEADADFGDDEPAQSEDRGRGDGGGDDGRTSNASRETGDGPARGDD